MDEFIEEIHQLRFITDEKHVSLLKKVVDEIIVHKLSNKDIVNLFAEVNAEIVDDILKMLEDENFLTKEEGNIIDKELINIYSEDFLKDLKSGDLNSRLSLKTNKNSRPITRFEILGIFFSKTLNEKLLWGKETTDDVILKALIQTHKELCSPKKERAIYDKQYKEMDTVVIQLIENINNFIQEI